MTTSMKSRVAVVTGAGRGIGRATALMLAKMGAKVVVNDFGGTTEGTGGDKSPAAQVVDEIKKAGGEAVANFESVADWDASKRIIDTAINTFGGIDVLVNNAGTLITKPIWEMDRQSFESVVQVHLMGTYYCTRHAVPHMLAKKYGRIVNCISRAGMVGSAGAAAYGAGKGGIFGFTNAIARDLMNTGVNVNAYNPGATITRMVAEKVDKATLERMKAVAQEPDDIAAVAAWLSTEACNFTGQSFLAQAGVVGVFPPFAPARTVIKNGTWTPEELAKVAPKFEIQPLKDLY